MFGKVFLLLQADPIVSNAEFFGGFKQLLHTQLRTGGFENI